MSFDFKNLTFSEFEHVTKHLILYRVVFAYISKNWRKQTSLLRFLICGLIILYTFTRILGCIH